MSTNRPNSRTNAVTSSSSLSLTHGVTFPFMSLPPEVRNMVCEELWRSNATIDTMMWSTPIQVQYKRVERVEKSTTQGLPTWILVSKITLSEALHLLRSQSLWVLVINRSEKFSSYRHSALLDVLPYQSGFSKSSIPIRLLNMVYRLVFVNRESNTNGTISCHLPRD